MTKPPMQLKESFYKKVHIELDEAIMEMLSESEEDEDTELSLSVQTDLQLLRSKEDDSKFIAELAIKTSDESTHPLTLDLVLVGMFEVDLSGDFESDKDRDTYCSRLVRINGGAMLYSAAREYLRVVSSRMPLSDNFQLPTVTPVEAFAPR